MVVRKFLFPILLVLLFYFFSQRVLAIYDPLSVPNNRFGIHILDVSEVNKAAQLVNSGGGDWGYVTIPIRANERDIIKWTNFMNECREKHIIPILRIASFPVGDHWMAPNEYDLVDFANFLNQLPWPTQNRYIVVYNEPNHDSEWGGFVNPGEYAQVLSRAVDIFHQRSSDFFVIAGGMDASSGAYQYEAEMDRVVPGIFEKVDGLSYHAYGNPGFETYPNFYSRVNIVSYRYEFSFSKTKPIFLTEAGWEGNGWYQLAFNNFWTDKNIVAITPFVLDARSGPFTGFSFVDADGNWKGFVKTLIDMTKEKGEPKLADIQTLSTAAGYQSLDVKNNLPNLSSIGLLFDWLHTLFSQLGI